MQLSTTVAKGAQQDFIELSRVNEIGQRASRWNGAAIFAKLSASGLVIASSGFGMVYAWTSGGHHDLTVFDVPVLAALTVLMALSLECAKPLAIARCLVAFRELKIAQGILLAALGLIAVAYSLSAGLSLMAMLRSDNAAQRQSVINAGADQAAAGKRLAERYEAAKGELASLAPSRPAAEVQAEIGGLLLQPGVNGCEVIDGSVTRKVCPKVTAARAELARAQRRAELQTAMTTAAAVPSPGPQPSEAAAVTVADPGAAALSTYLAIFGVAISPERLADWLVLLGVLSLEAGSALAGVLAGAAQSSPVTTSVTARKSPVITAVTNPIVPVAVTASVTAPATGAVMPVAPSKVAGREGSSAVVATAPVTALVAPVATAVAVPAQAAPVRAFATVPMTAVLASGRDEAARRLLALLRDNGGTVDASRQALARLIAATPSTAYAALMLLASQGRLEAAPSAKGTRLKLAA